MGQDKQNLAPRENDPVFTKQQSGRRSHHAGAGWFLIPLLFFKRLPAMKKNKGFTLIEVLAVVIILTILAAIVFSRFVNQIETAYITEAQQTLGILRNASATALDQGLTLVAMNVTTIQADMPTLRLKGIPATNFTYTCATAGTSCTATRVGDTAKTIMLTIQGVFTCGPGYTLVSPSEGCKVPKNVI
jgi:prepilin-type N-terminal cleavage/methylation domain-containing protein